MSTRISIRWGLTVITLLGLLAGGTLAAGPTPGALAAEAADDRVLAPPALPSLVPSSGWSWKAFDAALRALHFDLSVGVDAVALDPGAEEVRLLGNVVLHNPSFLG